MIGVVGYEDDPKASKLVQMQAVTVDVGEELATALSADRVVRSMLFVGSSIILQLSKFTL